MSLSQSFGGADVACEADTITALEFDDTGEFLATGDHGGRVVLFRANPDYCAYLEDIHRSNRYKRQQAAIQGKFVDGEGEEGIESGIFASAKDEGYIDSSSSQSKGEKGWGGDTSKWSDWDDPSELDGCNIAGQADSKDKVSSSSSIGHIKNDAEFLKLHGFDYGHGAHGMGGARTGTSIIKGGVGAKGSKQTSSSSSSHTSTDTCTDGGKNSFGPAPSISWIPVHQFQAHESEFDFLKSLEIAAKVNQLKFLPKRQSSSGRRAMLLSANDKTIKLWKLSDKHCYISGDSAKTIADEDYRSAIGEGNDNDSGNGNDNDNGNGNGNGGGRKLDSVTSSSGSFTSSEDDGDGCGGSSSSRYSKESEMISMRRRLLRLPTKNKDTITAASQNRSPLSASVKSTYANAHSYHINTLAISADGETFASVDDLRVNLWNIEDHRQCYNVIDCKPSNMEELAEVITSAAFHPTEAYTFAFSTSKGHVKIADMRQSALCQTFKTYMNTDILSNSVDGSVSANSIVNTIISDEPEYGVFSELMRSISDLKFASNGNYMATRDYLNIRVWDLKMTNRPLKTIPLHSHLKPLLPQLYESESIFDKFAMNYSPSGNKIVTGSYNHRFIVRDVITGKAVIEGELPNYLDSPQVKGCIRNIDLDSPPSPPHGSLSSTSEGTGTEHEVDRDQDFSTLDSHIDIRTDQRIVHCAWHPYGGMLAVAGVAGLHLYKL